MDAGASTAGAAATTVSPWPIAIPGTGAQIADPGDGRTWVVVTQIDPRAVKITAAAENGSLAVVLTHPRQGTPSCEAQLGSFLHTDQIDVIRTETAAAFRGTPWSPTAYLWHRGAQDLEFNCLRIGEQPWIAMAIAQNESGVTLLDAAPLALKLGTALAASNVTAGYPLRLDASGLALPDPHDDIRWIFLGRAPDFPFAADAIAFNPHNPGGVTLTVSVREGSCADAWDALRASLVTEGEIVDRPGYVPAVFGARIRRIPASNQLREVYCVGSTRGATMVTAVFGTTDSDAMSHAGPMLQSIVTAAAEGVPPPPATPSPAAAAPPASTPAHRGPASP